MILNFKILELFEIHLSIYFQSIFSTGIVIKFQYLAEKLHSTNTGYVILLNCVIGSEELEHS